MPILKFLGRGSAFNVEEGNTSAYLQRNNSLMLIDCGENIFERILKVNLLDDIVDVHVLITHLHPDHVASLGSFIFYCYLIKQIKPQVLFCDNQPLQQLLKIMGVPDNFYTLATPKEAVGLDNLNLSRIKPCKTEHLYTLESYGYWLLFRDGIQIYYAGDTNNLTQDILGNLKNLKELYVDTCLAEYPNNPHLSFSKLCSIIPPEHRNNVYCIHYDCKELIPKIEKAGFQIVETVI